MLYLDEYKSIYRIIYIINIISFLYLLDFNAKLHKRRNDA